MAHTLLLMPHTLSLMAHTLSLMPHTLSLMALFDATVHFSCICFVLAAPWISSVRSRL